ncbi:MAG: decarboxylating 6-phosphogluconate dehydrogenase, partial [Candidatus Eisenbacteria bacterium]|nr:decarboxylating 6-phosphogluconate dehydrogenase [Candidatus Eisenbacteria bacterium]
RSPDPIREVEEKGAIGASSIEDLISKLEAPRVVWVMVPSGGPTQSVLGELMDRLSPGDLVIDGGNSNFHESISHHEAFKGKGIQFLDIGVSGGVWGLKIGYNMMVGGTKEAVSMIAPGLDTLAPTDGWAHVGEGGAGHYVKMVHNGIEYGLMQAYAEGFEVLHKSRFGIDLEQVSKLWMNGSVIRSWLLDLAGNAFSDDSDLSAIKGFVPDSGEGRWTLQESVDLDVPAPVLYAALSTRFRSRQEESFQSKVLAALRNQFGGHAVKKSGKA